VKLIRDQLIEFPAARFVVDMTACRDQEFGIGIKSHWLFMKILLTIEFFYS